MRDTMALLLQELDADDLRQMLALIQHFKFRFADVARELLDRAEAEHIDQRIAMGSISAECLLLAACMHNGTPETFIEAAGMALEQREAMLPKTGTDQ